MFRSRPWCLNDAHLILKEWPNDMAISEVTFETSTFFIQVHGLPPAYLHEGTARMIGNKDGLLNTSSINRKCVVANIFLRFRVEIKVLNPLPVVYFMERSNGNDVWIQFKFERLSDFCFSCGSLDHVRERCSNKDPLIVTTPNRISARLFGPWLRAYHKGSVLFINTSERSHGSDEEEGEKALDTGFLQITSRENKEKGKDGQSSKNVTYNLNAMMEFNSARSMNPELDFLDMSVKQLQLGQQDWFQAMVMEQLSMPGFDIAS